MKKTMFGFTGSLTAEAACAAVSVAPLRANVSSVLNIALFIEMKVIVT